MNRSAIFNVIFCLLLLSACGNPYRIELDRINSLSEMDPKAALTALDSLPAVNLSENDRQYYSLIKVKCVDKAYADHTSDTIIKSVIEYYKTLDDKSKYREALFYGGRVYQDLGDFNSAIKFYQQAVDLIPRDNNKSNLRIRGNVLGQMARLSKQIRLYDKAKDHLTEAIEIDQVLNDSMNLMYDMEQLGHIYLHQKLYARSDSAYKMAISIAESKFTDNVLPALMYYANLKKYEGKIDSALMIIRGIPESISDDYKKTALAYAAGIYFNANIPDTAALYALELTKFKNNPNLKKAYYILSNPRLKNVVSSDSISTYIERYQNETEKYMQTNGARAALIQNSFYNYQTHEREKIKALRLKNKILIIAATTIFALAVMTILFLGMAIRKKKQYIRLTESLEKIKNLQLVLKDRDQALERLKSDYERIIECQNQSNDYFTQRRKIDFNMIREKTIKECLDVARNSSTKTVVSPFILNSDIYKELVKSMEQGNPIVYESRKWLDLEDLVLCEFPDFKNIMETMADKQLDDDTMHLLLLIKCGFKTSQIAILLAKDPQSIYSQRSRFITKIFGPEIKLQTKEFDNMIRTL